MCFDPPQAWCRSSCRSSPPASHYPARLLAAIICDDASQGEPKAPISGAGHRMRGPLRPAPCAEPLAAWETADGARAKCPLATSCDQGDGPAVETIRAPRSRQAKSRAASRWGWPRLSLFASISAWRWRSMARWLDLRSEPAPQKHRSECRAEDAPRSHPARPPPQVAESSPLSPSSAALSRPSDPRLDAKY